MDDTRVILMNNFLMSPGEAEFHANSMGGASNLYHRNPNMLAAAISLFTQYSEIPPTKSQAVRFINQHRSTLGVLKNFRANNPRVQEAYLRELIKYYRYVKEVRSRALALPMTTIDLQDVAEPGVIEVGDIEIS